MATIEEQYQQLVSIAQADSGVVGFILGGSRGKGLGTENSDYDITIIVEDDIAESARVKYKGYMNAKLDLVVMSKTELSLYGVWGSDTMWARYGFTHLKAVIDRTGELQKWLDEQEQIPVSALDDAVKQALGGYLNYTHRSLKNIRDVRTTPAHLAACDAMPQLITTLFALEGRVRPYNEYIEWELQHHPLKNFSMEPTAFNEKIKKVLMTGDEVLQKEFLSLVTTIAARHPVGAVVLKDWEGYYFG